MPMYTGIDDETKKMIRYPMFSFTREEDSKKLLKFLKFDLPKELNKILKLRPVAE